MGQQFLPCRWPLAGEQLGTLRLHVFLKIMNSKLIPRPVESQGAYTLRVVWAD